jgi:hypothetical protein
MKRFAFLCLAMMSGGFLHGEALPLSMPISLPIVPTLSPTREAVVEEVESVPLCKKVENKVEYWSQSLSGVMAPIIPVYVSAQKGTALKVSVENVDGLAGTIALAGKQEITGQKEVAAISEDEDTPRQTASTEITVVDPATPKQATVATLAPRLPEFVSRSRALFSKDDSPEYLRIGTGAGTVFSGSYGLLFASFGFKEAVAGIRALREVNPFAVADGLALVAPGVDVWGDGPIGSLRKKANEDFRSGDVDGYGEMVDAYIRQMEEAVKRRASFANTRGER